MSIRQYRLKYPEKFAGDGATVGYSSLAERKILKILDTNSSVVRWKLGTVNEEGNQQYNLVYNDNGSLIERVIVSSGTVKQGAKPTRRKTSNHQQGNYQLRNPEKYKGDINSVRYMSSWELSVHKFLDNNPNILEWASEEVVVPYIKPTDGKVHKYYIDYWVKYINREGNTVQELWEVKPKRETLPPKHTKKKKRSTILYEEVTYQVNKAKWESATLFAKQHGLTFKILTEDDIFK